MLCRMLCSLSADPRRLEGRHLPEGTEPPIAAADRPWRRPFLPLTAYADSGRARRPGIPTFSHARFHRWYVKRYSIAISARSSSSVRQQKGSGRDKAIYQDDHLQPGSFQVSAGHHGDLKPSYVLQDGERARIGCHGRKMSPESICVTPPSFCSSCWSLTPVPLPAQSSTGMPVT